jgi:uncharacterized protein (TIGR02147 family)
LNIFEYTDYKEYLKQYYQEKKEETPQFSYQLLSQKAGIKNRGYIYNTIHKPERTFNTAHCFKLSKALGHTKKEAEYFENIVNYANFVHLKDEEAAANYLRKALKIASESKVREQSIQRYQFEYLSRWYHSAIRSLMDIFPVSDNYEEVGKKLLSSVTPSQVKKSIELLERLGLIIKGEDGMYRLTDKNVRANKDISQVARNQFHIECIDLAKQTIQNESPQSRHAMSITMSISKETYGYIVNDTREFVEKIVSRIKNDTNPDRVYQYELLLFPLSKDETNDQSGRKK